MRTVPAARDHAGVLVPVEVEVRWDGRERGAAVAGAGAGKPAVEAHRGRAGGGNPGVEGCGRKKAVGPQLRREAVLVTRGTGAESATRL